MQPDKRPLTIIRLIKPYSGTLLIALFAAIGEAITDLLSPWPMKVVIDDILKPKGSGGWLNSIIYSAVGDG